MKNIISKIIPEVSSSLFQNSNSNLRNIQQEGKIREFDKDKNQIKIEENELDNDKFIGSSILSSSEINIDDEGNIKSVSSKSKSEFKGDENIQIEDISIDENSLLKFDDIKEDNDNVRSGLIKNCEIESESNILLIENNIDENIKNIINNLEKQYNLDFIEYENEENKVLRLLGLKKENGMDYNEFLKDNNYENVNDIRNLKIDSFYQPIQFSYSIFKNNILGVLVGMNAFVSFIPNIGELNTTLIYRINNNVYQVFSKAEYINFVEIADTINNIKDKTMIAIALKQLNLKEDFKDYIKQIGEQLNIIKSQLENPYDISNIYTNQLKELVENIKFSSINTYEKVQNNIKEVSNDFNDLNTRINNNIDNNSSEIISISKNNLDNIIMNQRNLMNEIYNNMCLFTDNVLNRLATTVSFNFDIDSFYSYNETINTAISIMENLINEIFISVLSEEENFKIYTLETEFKIQLDEILKENEIIAERLITNQTLIDSIPENKRTEMINTLNNYRNEITQILKNILNKISKEYNNRINTTLSNSDLSILENDLNSKIEDLKVRRNNMINFLRKFR